MNKYVFITAFIGMNSIIINCNANKLFVLPPHFYGTAVIAQQNFMDDIAETCKGTDTCYDSTEIEYANYKRQCVAYKLPDTQKHPELPHLTINKLLIGQKSNFSIFLKQSTKAENTIWELITEKNNKRLDTIIISEEHKNNLTNAEISKKR